MLQFVNDPQEPAQFVKIGNTIANHFGSVGTNEMHGILADFANRKAEPNQLGLVGAKTSCPVDWF